MTTLRVRCPATSANLGPGFDALGLALDLANAFEVEEAERGFEVRAEGPGAARIPSGPENLLVRAYQATRAALSLTPAPGLRVRASIAVPPSRGLGSSATATVAGVLAAAAHAGVDVEDPDRRDWLLERATDVEGHPDNVTPCLLGGLCVAARDAGGALIALRAVPTAPPALAVAIPRDLELSTAAMRAALPDRVPFADAVFTVGRASLLCFALLSGEAPGNALRAALDDRLHQPYRGAHIPGFDAARAAAREAGAYGAVISGSGPTLLALAPDPGAAQAAADAMREALAAAGVVADARVLGLDLAGASVQPLAP